MELDNEIEDTVIENDDSIRVDLEKAFYDVEGDPKIADKPEAQVDKPIERVRDENGKFAKADTKPAKETKPEIAEEKIPEPPRSWTATEKERWKEATPEVRQAILRRETEVEQGFTKLDEDRNFGKSIKEIITPYMPLIQAEGGTPVAAVQSLLNTAYIMRTASPEKKTELFHQLAQQYGVDLKSNAPTVQPDQIVKQLQTQVQQLQQQIQQQPDVFRQQQENQALKSQIDAFAADPKNAHYEKLKPVMASLLQSGQATDMQDAYDKASWADPEIRSSILADQQREAEEKRIAEIKAKANKSRNTAVSVRGSPSISAPPTNGSGGSISDDLRAAWDEHAA